MSSTKTGHHNLVLGVISAAEAEQLLCDWANLPGTWPFTVKADEKSLAKVALRITKGNKEALAKFKSRQKLQRALVPEPYRSRLPDTWPFVQNDREELAKFAAGQERMRQTYGKLFGESEVAKGIIGDLSLRELLRKAWDASDPRQREWVLFRLRDAYSRMSRRHDMPPDEMLKEDLEDDVKGPHYAAPPITPLEAALVHFQDLGERNHPQHCRGASCQNPYFIRKRKGQEFCSPECARPARLESQRRWWHEHRGGKAVKSKRGKK